MAEKLTKQEIAVLKMALEPDMLGHTCADAVRILSRQMLRENGIDAVIDKPLSIKVD